MKKLNVLIISVLICFIGCSDDDDNTVSTGTLTINFTHSWKDSPITVADFDQISYTTANTDEISITKLRYLISNITLNRSDNSTLKVIDYILVDLNNDNLIANIQNIPFGEYSSISFTFGFNETDNIDGFYADLNSASWNWPEMLGGGYHFMQLEGKYDDNGIESPYAYHMGTARVSDGVFEQNYFETEIDGFEFSSEREINIHMDISEWFENPIVWDLSVYNTSLMPNYDAQKMMHQNGESVFSLGENK